MVALSAIRSGCVAARNVEVTCIRPAQVRNMFVKYIFVIQLSIFLDQEIDLGPNSIGKKIITKIITNSLSKSYNKKWRKNSLYIFPFQIGLSWWFSGWFSWWFFSNWIGPQTPLFQMKYDSLLNSKQWPSNSPKGSGTPWFLPTHSVLLLYSLPNHPFWNLDFSGLDQLILFKLDFVVSCCSSSRL